MDRKKWNRKYASRTRLTPVRILTAIGVLSMLILCIQFSLIGRHLVEDIGDDFTNDRLVLYPDSIYTSKWATPVPDDDILHLGLLHEACMTHVDSVILWTYGRHGNVSIQHGVIERDDPNLIDKIRSCPDVDIFLPLGIRTPGYCEDAVGYTKYLESRILPTWAIEMKYLDKKTGKTLTYHDLCPKTPMIFMNHYWDGIPFRPEWPKTKHLYLMPNIEMFELKAQHYWGVHAVLCKTAVCARRVRLWYQQEGNPNNAIVVYSRHTSSHIAQLARYRLGKDAIKPKDYTNIKFVHVVGTSMQKGTSEVIDCWLQNQSLPQLDLYISDQVFNAIIQGEKEKKIAQTNGNIVVHKGHTNVNAFGKMMAEASFALCTSPYEGYGHYINQARATSAVIIAADLPPMNEMLSPRSGILMQVPALKTGEQLLSGGFEGEHGLRGVTGLKGKISWEGICEAVGRVIRMSPQERHAMGQRAQMQYHIDINFFAAKMKELRLHARGEKSFFRSS